MSKEVHLLFLGVCVIAVHMALAGDEGKETPEDLEKKAEALRALVSSKGADIEAAVRKTDASFNFDSWWRVSMPVLKVVNKVVPPNPENAKELCKQDEAASDRFMNSYGPQVEAVVKKDMKDFNWDNWWSKSKKVLKVIGDVLDPVSAAAKELCKKQGKA